MAARARRDQVSLLNDRIDILDRNATGPVSLKEIFKTVSAIQALVRDKMANNKDPVQLADYCFNVCWALKAAIGVENEGDLDESGRIALNGLHKTVSEIERTLRRGASTPRTEYDKDRIEQFKLEIQEALDDFNSQSSLLDGNSMEKLVLQSPLVSDIRGATTTSVSEIAFERLVRREFASDELFSLIEDFLAGGDPDHMIRRLSKDDAQTFIDVMDEGLDRSDLPLWARKQCLKLLYRTCGIYALLPGALKVPICYDRATLALYRGGYADVWKGEYRDQDVAVKVIRTYKNSDLKKILGKFCKEVVTWKTLQHPNVLSLVGVIMSEVQFAMVSDWMPNGNINEFVKANPDTNRLKLLADVARGLIYIHEREMIHGDLKGANILIDEACNARLADFGLLMVLSDPGNLMASSSYNQGGTARWMSPELIAPQEFGLKTSRPTTSSDCYSLGMVIYETITGNLPFQEDTDITVFLKVVRGERPRREAGFSRTLWKKLKQCWASQSADRPSIENVLQCLERCSLLEWGTPPIGDSSHGADTANGGRNRPKSMGRELTPTEALTGSDYDGDLSEEPPDSIQDEEDVIRCICEDKSDRGEIMIQCDNCMVWQHVMCMMVEVPPDDAEYFCEQCRPDLHANLFKRESSG